MLKFRVWETWRSGKGASMAKVLAETSDGQEGVMVLCVGGKDAPELTVQGRYTCEINVPEFGMISRGSLKEDNPAKLKAAGGV